MCPSARHVMTSHCRFPRSPIGSRYLSVTNRGQLKVFVMTCLLSAVVHRMVVLILSLSSVRLQVPRERKKDKLQVHFSLVVCRSLHSSLVCWWVCVLLAVLSTTRKLLQASPCNTQHESVRPARYSVNRLITSSMKNQPIYRPSSPRVGFAGRRGNSVSLLPSSRPRASLILKGVLGVTHP